LIEDYFHKIASLIDAEACIEGASMAYDKRTPHIGFLHGSLFFSDGSLLHIREYVNVQDVIERYMYVYQYQDREGVLVFRYDNSPHFPQLPTFPHHKHDGSESNVIRTNPPHLGAVLEEIRSLLRLRTI
jgi:hypothetical protein